MSATVDESKHGAPESDNLIDLTSATAAAAADRDIDEDPAASDPLLAAHHKPIVTPLVTSMQSVPPTGGLSVGDASRPGTSGLAESGVLGEDDDSSSAADSGSFAPGPDGKPYASFPAEYQPYVESDALAAAAGAGVAGGVAGSGGAAKRVTWVAMGDPGRSVPSRVPRLCDLIVKAFADNYHLYPALDRLPPEFLENACALLDPSRVDLPTAARFIAAEPFWRRLATARWPLADPSRHGNSWKRAFVERHLNELLERYFPSADGLNLASLLREAAALRPFVHCVATTQLLPQLDVASVLDNFPHLTSLRLKFGSPSLGMDYDPALMGLQLSGALSVARIVAGSRSLLTVSLRENLVGDEAAHVLTRGLLGNGTLLTLDLSHNRIGDAGARRLARALAAHPTLAHVDLSHNSIGEAGARALAEAVAANPGLRSLDLGLNPLGDAGAAAVLAAAATHPALERLALGACALGPASAQALGLFVGENRVATSLDISGNPALFAGESAAGAAAGSDLLVALRGAAATSALTEVKILRSKADEGVAKAVTALLFNRRAAAQQRDRKAYQTGWDELH